MDPWFPTRAFLPTPPPLLAMQMAEEEWSVNARCIAAGLPPFPNYNNSFFLPQDHIGTVTATGFDLHDFVGLDATPLQHKLPPLVDPRGLLKPLKIETAETAGTPTTPSGEAPPLLLLPPPPPSQISPDARRNTNKRPRLPTLGGPRIPESVAARMRRRSISDRTAILAGLMPWERKMSISAMLEEAHKYVRFLEAQVAALRYMPQDSYFSSSYTTSGHQVIMSPSPAAEEGPGYGVLDLLSRQQLLEVMVNSALVQERLYKKGLCVCSVEQMVLMRRIVERRRLKVEDMRQAESSSTTVSNCVSN